MPSTTPSHPTLFPSPYAPHPSPPSFPTRRSSDLEARVVKVAVTDLKENTFFAVLHLQVAGAEYQVDSRPSDAIALALRVGAPIYVDEDVVRKAKTLDVATPKEADTLKADDPERVREWLGSIKPEDFEKFNKA